MDERAGWTSGAPASWLDGKAGLADVAKTVSEGTIDPKPRSGGQERLENLINRYV